MKKPYLKKYSTISNFTVWIADGKYIRENIDEEFTNCGAHYRFRFIPKDEIWVDKEHGTSSEIQFYILGLLTMIRLLKKGKTHAQAVRISNEIEKRERKKSKFFRDTIGKTKKYPEEIHKIHKKLLKKYSKGKINVWIVNGILVRDLFFIDFTEGGHDKVYHFIPKNEVWIDDDISQRERKFVLLHEIHERNLMAKKWPYQKAHFDSSRIEFFCRHNPKELDKKIFEEIKKTI